MLSWQLWQAIYQPPQDHPVFRDTLRRLKPKPSPRTGCWRVLHWLFLVLCGCTALSLGLMLLAFLPGILSAVLRYILDPNPVPVVFLMVTPLLIAAAGAKKTLQIITQARANNTYDLACLLPFGPLTFNWLVYLAGLHDRNQFRRGEVWLRRVLGGLVAIHALALGLILMPYGAVGAAGIVFYSVVPVLLLYLHHAQSIVLSSQVTLLAMSIEHYSVDQWNWSGVIDLLLHGMILLLSVVMTFAVMPPRGWLQLTDWQLLVLTISFGVAVLFALREAVIRLLWYAVRRRYAVRRDGLAALAAA
jgi:hypothetical protein